MPRDLELNDILHSGQLAAGKYVSLFERSVKDYLNTEQFLSLSCSPIYFALKLLNIQPGDEVILSPMSCLMTTQPVLQAHAKLVWADVDPLTGTLDPESVRKKISKFTKAIIHYHWAGYPGHIDDINHVAGDHGITVIDEASMAFGSEYKNKKLGALNSDITCFNFGPVRLPNTIDGAGICVGCPEKYELAIRMRDLGVDRKIFRDRSGEIDRLADVSTVGVAAKLNEINGFIGSVQMESVDSLLEKQRRNAKKWRLKLEHKLGVSFLDDRNEINPNYWVYCVLSNPGDEDLFLELRNQGYQTSRLHIRNDVYSVYSNFRSKEELKGVADFEARQVCVPCGWWFDGPAV